MFLFLYWLFVISVAGVLLQLITSIGEWGIDIFELSELSNGRPLTVVGYTLFKVS